MNLILTETFNICRFALVCLPLLIVPKMDSRIVEGIFALACVLLLRAVATSGVAPLEGLYDLATGCKRHFVGAASREVLISGTTDHRNRDVHTAANIAADLERHAWYHILGWRALQVAIGESTSGAEGDDAIVRMLMDSVSSCPPHACSFS